MSRSLYSSFRQSRAKLRSSYGKVDNLTSLQNNDDAAFIQTGGVGRIPTKEEVEELIKYCCMVLRVGPYSQSQTGPRISLNATRCFRRKIEDFCCKTLGF